MHSVAGLQFVLSARHLRSVDDWTLVLLVESVFGPPCISSGASVRPRDVNIKVALLGSTLNQIFIVKRKPILDYRA